VIWLVAWKPTRSSADAEAASIPGLCDAMQKKVTRREQFLSEMDAVVTWTRLLALIAPHHPKAGPKGGQPPSEPYETADLTMCWGRP
jgi:hypothetical protein